MPKYFANERPLLFRKAVLRPSDLTVEVVRRLFASQSAYSFCIVFEGFDASCLGFVVHVRKNGEKYEVLNIVDEPQLIVLSDQALIDVLKHVSGVEYSDKIQAAFHQIRTDVGSGTPFQSDSPS